MRNLVLLAMIAGSFALLSFAQGSTASLSAPTGLQAGEVAALQGSSFPADIEITLEITPPDGRVARQAIKTDAEGNFTYDLTLGQAGEFLVSAKTAKGIELARATIYAARPSQGS